MTFSLHKKSVLRSALSLTLCSSIFLSCGKGGIIIDYGAECGFIGAPGFLPNVPKAVAVDSNGNIFAAGKSSAEHWLVRSKLKDDDDDEKSTKWTISDDFYIDGQSHFEEDLEVSGDFGYNVALAVAVDSKDNIFVTGSVSSRGEDHSLHWITRKSSNHGKTWITSDDYTIGNNVYGGKPSAIAIASSNVVYTVGKLITHDKGQSWIVRSSIDGGSTWSTVDNYQMTSGIPAEALAVTVDGSGNVWVVGSASDSSDYMRGSSPSKWVVRMSSDQGKTWTTMDNYSAAPAYATASSISIDQLGNIYVAGTAQIFSFDSLDQKSNSVIIRKSNDQGKSWTIVSTKSVTDGQFTIPKLVADSNNIIYSLYGAGLLESSSDGGHTWVQISTPNFSDYSKSLYYNPKSKTLYLSGLDSSNAQANWKVWSSSDSSISWKVSDDLAASYLFIQTFCL